MLFNSLDFVIFFPVVYIAYLLLKHRWQNRLLIIGSGLFYASWNWKFLSIMLVSITTDYFCARQIYHSSEKNIKRRFLIISLLVNLIILGFFKYFNFFTANFLELFKSLHLLNPGIEFSLKIILPLGISFYTFEAISYTVDVYRGLVKPAEKYSDYLLFVIYFPHLIAGPIMRAKNFLPQISTPRVVTLELFYEGSYLFFWGLFEKMFIADNLAKIVNPIFASQGPYEGGAVLVALYAFAFQIFCDFDGYSNMARGLGLCMGFDISINFKLPYFSVNPKEFWQRWHITLSSWLRDYLYIPLGGNRNGELRMYGAILLTMLLGGLWHGAAWNFVLWGLYQAVLLIIHRLLTRKHEGPPKRNIFKVIIFFHLVIIGWLLFRAQSFGQIVQMLQGLFFNFQIGQQDLSLWFRLIGFISPLLIMQIWQAKTNDLVILYKQPWIYKVAIYALLTYLFLGWAIMKPEEFVYFQF